MQISVAELHEAIAATRPDRECLVFRDRRLTWADVTERTRRLANVLIDADLGCHTERSELSNWESGQDHLAIYLHNGNEYLECMLGAFKARVAPFNVNYRYVADELRYLLRDAGARAIVVQSAFAPTLAEVLPDVPSLQVILQVPDASGHDLLPGARWYEDALAAASPQRPSVTWSPDDLYILYTGGTTGMPKGVLWRNGDALTECFGAPRDVSDLASVVAAASGTLRSLPAPPFMHGAGHWIAFRTWTDGGCVFVQSRPDRLDPAVLKKRVQRHGKKFAVPRKIPECPDRETIHIHIPKLQRRRQLTARLNAPIQGLRLQKSQRPVRTQKPLRPPRQPHHPNLRKQGPNQAEQNQNHRRDRGSADLPPKVRRFFWWGGFF